MTDSDKVYLSLDFNSLSNLREGSLKLTAYYISYAFHGSEVEPRDGLPIVFYDEYWLTKESSLPSLRAVLTQDEDNSWRAVLSGQIFLSDDNPLPKYTSAFIGSSSFLMENGQKAEIQKLGDQPEKDVLRGMSCFACAPNSEFPDFAKIIGMDAKRIENFFTFSDVKMLAPETDADGRLVDETLVVRGGRNQNS